MQSIGLDRGLEGSSRTHVIGQELEGSPVAETLAVVIATSKLFDSMGESDDRVDREKEGKDPER